MPTGAQRIEAALSPQVDAGASAEAVADAACEVWKRIDAALAPIVGRHGVAALYKRSLHLARAKHPELSAASGPGTSPGDFSALHAVLAAQPGGEATSLNVALLTTFYDLLSSLIGAALTERLLNPVWADSSNDAPAQDSSP